MAQHRGNEPAWQAMSSLRDRSIIQASPEQPVRQAEGAEHPLRSPAVAAEPAIFIRIAGAVGVEYFFTNHFSAGATLELSLKLANLAGPASTPIYTSLSTATSSLSANIYF